MVTPTCCSHLPTWAFNRINHYNYLYLASLISRSKQTQARAQTDTRVWKWIKYINRLTRIHNACWRWGGGDIPNQNIFFTVHVCSHIFIISHVMIIHLSYIILYFLICQAYILISEQLRKSFNIIWHWEKINCHSFIYILYQKKAN